MTNPFHLELLSWLWPTHRAQWQTQHGIGLECYTPMIDHIIEQALLAHQLPLTHKDRVWQALIQWGKARLRKPNTPSSLTWPASAKAMILQPSSRQ